MRTGKLRLPDEPGLLAAAGRVALAHGQLEYVLRMTVKSILSRPTREVLDATEGENISKIRDLIKKLLRVYVRDEVVNCQIRALLTRAGRAAERRNKLIHRPWLESIEGGFIVKGDEHIWGAPPSAAELEGLAEKITEIAVELNDARLEGGVLCEALKARKGLTPGKPALAMDAVSSTPDVRKQARAKRMVR
jgi:hypothetical protein